MVAVLLGVPLVLAAGCAGSGATEPAADAVTRQADATTTAPSPASEQAPSLTASVEPWELVELPDRGPTVPGVDLEGAKNAATVLIAAYAGGLRSGNTHNIEVLSDANCNFCKRVIVDVRERAEKGQVLAEDFSWSFAELLAGEPIEGMDGHLVVMKYSSTPWNYVDESGVLVDSEPAEKENLLFLVRMVGSGWVVSGVERLSDDDYESILAQMQG